MNFTKITVPLAIQFINEHKTHNDAHYKPCKEDTTEAIEDLYHMDRSRFTDIPQVFDWFISNFGMYPSHNGSYYRAFIAIKRDVIINLRVSNHFSTKKSVKGAFKKGLPDIEYHMVLGRTTPIDPSKDVYKQSLIQDVQVLVYDIDLSMFIDEEGGDEYISYLVYLLTNGPDSPCESRQYKNNKVQISESDLRHMVKETITRILAEQREKTERKDYSYKPIGSHKFWTNNGETEWKSIITLQTPYSKQCCHIAEDDHCYILFNGSGLNDKNCEMINWIFPEAFKALKSLPLL